MWFGSYLSSRRQRVKVNRHVSSWKSLNGSMPQGSRLGPLSFIVMIDDLRAPCESHKYVDDTTLKELIPSSCFTSDMPQIFDSVLSWTASNNMQINTSKTKEMIFGSLSTANLPYLSTSAGLVERVSTFKLLGLNFDASLSWSVHITIITTKASKRLYFLKQLKRVGVPPQQLLHFYARVIRPVLEYSAPQSGIMPSLDYKLNIWSLCKSVLFTLFILLLGACHILIIILFVAELTSLESRRDQLSRSFFQDISHPSSSLCHLLPPLHVLHLSCLGSEKPHGLHVLSRAPKNIVPSLSHRFIVCACVLFTCF